MSGSSLARRLKAQRERVRRLEAEAAASGEKEVAAAPAAKKDPLASKRGAEKAKMARLGIKPKAPAAAPARPEAAAAAARKAEAARPAKRPRPAAAAAAAAPIKAAELGHAFEVDYCDHFETPAEAYEHVAPVLRWLAARLGREPASELRVWDPYYCAGRVRELLAAAGFPRVHNRNEDFYEVARRGRQPEHDVLVTNPAYSGTHKERCLEYCAGSGRPWMLLMPAYVATKQYYTAAARRTRPFFVVPRHKYEFAHPEGTGHETSPFFGIWFVDLGDARLNDEAAAAFRADGATAARSLAALAATGAVVLERRLNPRQRRKRRKQQMARR